MLLLRLLQVLVLVLVLLRLLLLLFIMLLVVLTVSFVYGRCTALEVPACSTRGWDFLVSS